MNAWAHLAPFAAAHAMNAGIVGLALVGILWVALRLSGKQSSRARFAIWFVGLLAVAALPFLFAQRLVSNPASSFVALPSRWAEYFVALWAIGTTVGILRIAAGLMRLRQLRSNAVGIAPASLPVATAAKLQNDGGWRDVLILRSDEVSVPMVIGFVRPAILLPSSLVPQLSEEELDVIVLHEMAHIRRWDDWTNLVQKVVKAVFFFHPAVWWIDGRLTLEREMACDEMVLAQSPSAKAYAGFLISFHEKLQSAGAPVLVQALVSKVSQLAERVTEILEAKKPAKSRVPAFAASAALLAALGAAPMLPEFVSFGNAPEIAKSQAPAKHVSTTHTYDVSAVIPSVETQVKVINASYTPGTVQPVKAKTARKRRPAPQQIAEKVPAKRPMLVVYQSAQFDGANWTICVWSVDPATNRTVQSFVLKI
ncbi:peptidase M56, BlaR1 [Candidatus Koribacter versatilis Ellin345]|uniref:Peptidase M56, BlaR1 n=1 Tax=Koribacter versatilis (strain Ellin345) TaxID=204669 RepID=Q1ILF2_KORVE|nr:M56 family metallopeptidase [Candidatus Koribacter versatilis]ABF42298.1 peptidase M56, BlaR1 [Candidatus Koribacter versatilis Ellin345]